MALDQNLVGQMQKLCLAENQTLWEQGDLLVAAKLSDDDMQKLADSLQRKVKTLNKRMKVAKEFPPNKRDHRHAFTIYEVLSRIPGPDNRDKILNARNEWTVDSMTSAVNSWLDAEAKKAGVGSRVGTPSRVVRSGLKVGNHQVKAELTDDGQLSITVEGVSVEPKVVVMTNRTLTIYDIERD